MQAHQKKGWVYGEKVNEDGNIEYKHRRSVEDHACLELSVHILQQASEVERTSKVSRLNVLLCEYK